MPIIDFTNAITVLLALILFVLVLFLAKETKKSQILIATLVVFSMLLIGHSARMFLTPNIEDYLYRIMSVCVAVDFVFIFLSFISYLWIDDIQAKIEKKKSIDNGLDWFWANVK